MRLAQLVGTVARQAKLPPRQTQDFIILLIDEMLKVLATGEKLRIPGVGEFEAVYRPPRKKVNNLSGQQIMTRPRIDLKFRPYRRVRDLLMRQSPVGEILRQADIVR